LLKSKPAVVRPIAPARYEIRFTAREETRDKLRRAQDLLSHALPSGDIAEVVDRALTLLLADLERKKCAATSRPRPRASPSPSDEAIPAEVKRAVWARDAGRCAFVARDGHRCAATRFLEFHHLTPRARGGRGTVDNIALRCRAHNGHEVDVFFGPGVRWTPEGATTAARRGGSGTTPGGADRPASRSAGPPTPPP
jgi:5-methylcytosine-specific restriction endonuclease McrA